MSFGKLLSVVSKSKAPGFIVNESGNVRYYDAREASTKAIGLSGGADRVIEFPTARVLREISVPEVGSGMQLDPESPEESVSSIASDASFSLLPVVNESKRQIGWYATGAAINTQPLVFVCENGHKNGQLGSGFCQYCPAKIKGVE